LGRLYDNKKSMKRMTTDSGATGGSGMSNN